VADCDLAVIEGNRGLFDGMDLEGTYSTAELAKLLRTPVVLVVDATKTTRTLGAVVLGCQRFDPAVDLRGVILNRVAGSRHESLLREVVEHYCKLPVVGAIPRLAEDPFPGRHLGLVPPPEHDAVPRAIQRAACLVAEHLDLEALESIARGAEPPARGRAPGVSREGRGPAAGGEVRIGVFRDAAFQFYYPENLEALAREGARLVEISPLADRGLPEVDALYMGGGFPETSAAQLAANVEFRRELVSAVEAGLPVYAECGGAVYLGESLVMSGNTYPMAGVLPVRFGFEVRPQGHGYAALEVVGENPFFPLELSLRGHEFHYTRVLDMDEEKLSFAFRVERGQGIDGRREGLCRKNVLASYCHVHALGVESWASSLVRAAASHRQAPRG
jgi:cobyrinic acid a,c-diamide synthase